MAEAGDGFHAQSKFQEQVVSRRKDEFERREGCSIETETVPGTSCEKEDGVLSSTRGNPYREAQRRRGSKEKTRSVYYRLLISGCLHAETLIQTPFRCLCDFCLLY